jgi:hypothetical protein
MYAIDSRSRYVPFAAHQSTNSTRFTKVEACKLRRNAARDELGKESEHANKDDVTPIFAGIKSSQVGLQAGKSEVLEDSSACLNRVQWSCMD